MDLRGLPSTKNYSFYSNLKFMKNLDNQRAESLKMVWKARLLLKVLQAIKQDNKFCLHIANDHKMGWKISIVNQTGCNSQGYFKT